MRTLLLLLATVCLAAPAGAKGGLLPNSDFEAGLEGWRFAPGDPETAVVTDAGPPRGKVLELRPAGKLLGIQTDKLALGKELEVGANYEVTAQIKHEALETGVFAFSMYCYDAAGKSLKQISFYGLSASAKPHDWRKQRGQFGPGTPNPLPEGTSSVCIRFSFYEKSGDCRGKMLVDDVELTKKEPAKDATWPREILADVDDLQVRFESRSFWSLYRIDYKGDRLCRDTFGSHYGTVANYPGVGFIGTGHTENEDEQVLALALTVDGKPVEKPEAAYKCKEIRLTKDSKIRDLALRTVITVAEGRIVEDVVLKAEQPSKMTLIYHFMHPWVDAATDFLAELPDGSKVEGAFNSDGGQKVDKPVRWSAIYVAPMGKGAVTYVAAVPAGRTWSTRYWDKGGVYRKHYLTTFMGETVPTGEEFHYRAITMPFAAGQDAWKEAAAKVAAACAKDTK